MDSKQPTQNIFDSPAEEPEEGAKQFEIEADITDTGIDPFDHSVEAAKIKEAESSDGIHIPEPPARESMPINNPAIMGEEVINFKEAVDASFKATFQKREVEVTVAERDTFMRAALHDKEMVFQILIEGLDAVIDVAIPTDKFTTSAAAAARAWGKSGFIDPDSLMEFELSFQQMHAWFQVRAVNGEPTEWSIPFADGIPSTGELRRTLANPENFETIFAVNAVRWRMFMEAMQIAELKYKLCLEAWQDRSFFTTAGPA